MSITYAQKNKNAVQTKRESSVSIIDTSFQSESLQRKADMANNAAQRAEAPRPNNTGMPDNLKSGIESLSGFSMDDVRVHYNSSKPATVQALAYTQGTDIHVAPGQEKHLPHEAWHVAQQMAGRVSPTTNINGMPVNDNAVLEHEADVMGEKAVQCKKYACQKKEKMHFFQSPIQCYTKQGEYVLSEGKKYAVKDNEASTVYLHKNEDASVVEKLLKLGIRSTGNEDPNLKDYYIYEQLKPVNLKKQGRTEIDSEDDLNNQYELVKKLIIASRWLLAVHDKMPQYLSEDFLGKDLLHELKTESYISHLGKDIIYAYYLIKKWNSQPNQIDKTVLNFVLDDLELRLSQIDHERNNTLENYDGMKTECGASDQQRREVLPDAKTFGVDITNDRSNDYLVRWNDHYSTQIATDGNDVLCVEDASGKSGGRYHLAKAHWFARIYGLNQDTNPLEKSSEHSFNMLIPALVNIPKDFKFSLQLKNENRKLDISYKSNSFFYKYEGVFKSASEDDFLLQTAYSVLKGILVRMCFNVKENFEIQYGPETGDLLYKDFVSKK